MTSREEYESVIERLTKALNSTKAELRNIRAELIEANQTLERKRAREVRLRKERDMAQEAARIALKKVSQLQSKSSKQSASGNKARPEKFSGSGNDTDFQAFIDQFEACTRMKNLNDEEKRNQLILCVKDRAGLCCPSS